MVDGLLVGENVTIYAGVVWVDAMMDGMARNVRARNGNGVIGRDALHESAGDL